MFREGGTTREKGGAKLVSPRKLKAQLGTLGKRPKESMRTSKPGLVRERTSDAKAAMSCNWDTVEGIERESQAHREEKRCSPGKARGHLMGKSVAKIVKHRRRISGEGTIKGERGELRVGTKSAGTNCLTMGHGSKREG